MKRQERLRARGVDGLAALLRRRPEVLHPQPPRTLSELVTRLDSAQNLRELLSRLATPQLQALLASSAFGTSVVLARLQAVLGADAWDPLADLAELDLLTISDGVVAVNGAVRQVVPPPGPIGPPLVDLARSVPVMAFQAAARVLGLPAPADKQALVGELAAFYGDPVRMGELIADLPPRAIEALLSRVPDHHPLAAAAWNSGYGIDWEEAEEIDRFGLELGLMVGTRPGHHGDARMPAEACLTLLGPDFRLPFDPEPPEVATLPVSRVDDDAAAAATAFDAAATAVLDQVAAAPVTTVKAGGVGRRELTRLARATSTDVDTVHLVLELAGRAELLEVGQRVVTSRAFPAWRSAEPAARLVALLAAWRRFPGVTGVPGDDGAPARALDLRLCQGCAATRRVVLEVLRPDAGLAVESVVASVVWRTPLGDVDEPHVRAHLAEAQRLGLVAQGALTALGVAHLADDDAALLAAAGSLLPASTDEAVFGSDLTAFVGGSPSARVSAVLDSCATRESVGGAVTWRLSPATVRRHLDTGAAVEDLRSTLRSVAAGGTLPGAVEVLLDDLARQYGRARVVAAAGVIVSEDAALLAQLMHDRKLAACAWEQIAPTVLVSALDPNRTAAAMRAAGYLPAWAPPAAAAPPPDPLAASTATWRAAELMHAAIPVEAVAASLLAAPETTSLGPPASSAIRRHNPRLSVAQVRLLAEAVETGARVRIVYRSAQGAVTDRVIRPEDQLGDRLFAYCEDRQEEREFLLGRILEVGRP